MVPAYQGHAFRSACGRLELFARDYPGDGPPLLLMHGLTRNSADFEPLAAHLADRFRLVVPDQRGRGRSAYDDDPANYRPDIYAADMFALLDSLGIERVKVIGTSMGGLVAMVMAAMQPDRIGAIVFNDIGPHIDPDGLARIQSYVSQTGAAFSDWHEAADRCAAINGPAFPDYGPQDWLAFARRTCREAADGTVVLDYDPAIGIYAVGDDPDNGTPDIWPLWDALDTVPVLVVRGTLSDILSAETVAQMAKRHSGPFASAEISGRGHAPILDEPEALGAIDLFLGRFAG